MFDLSSRRNDPPSSLHPFPYQLSSILAPSLGFCTLFFLGKLMNTNFSNILLYKSCGKSSNLFFLCQIHLLFVFLWIYHEAYPRLHHLSHLWNVRNIRVLFLCLRSNHRLSSRSFQVLELGYPSPLPLRICPSICLSESLTIEEPHQVS